MAPSVEVTIWKENRPLWSGVSPLPLEIGRQRRDEDKQAVLSVREVQDHHRLVIVPITNLTLPRRAVRLSLRSDRQLELTNVHSRLTFHVGLHATPLPPGESAVSYEECILSLPDSLAIKATLLPENPLDLDDGEELSSFRVLTDDPAATMQLARPTSFTEWFAGHQDQAQGKAAVDLVRQALAVVQKSAGTNEFFDAAVRSAAEMVSLDRAYILLHEELNWRVRSKFIASEANAETSIDASAGETLPSGCKGLLRRMLITGQTVLYDPNAYAHTAAPSMMVLDRAVATPIRNEGNQIVGALYGDRRLNAAQSDPAIGDLEATLLEVMAGAVSAGLARQRQEAIRASLTQFFSPAVTERLEHNEDLLSGRDAEVTVLFCDIRGFSRICERVGPQRTFDWINDVLTQLSECVMRTDGVLVDYVGDELMAMWGAPGDQPDHAALACQAACEMLAQIEPLRQRWNEITPDTFGVGIGINTGPARVGNTGSNVKFKYGPLGNTVNLASRIQGITKRFSVTALVTEATARAVDRPTGIDFPLRRLATVRPFGVQESVTLYELRADAGDDWQALKASYEQALDCYHRGELDAMRDHFTHLETRFADDGPTRWLHQRLQEAVSGDTPIDPVWKLDSK